jgi:hypothetical protein
MIVSLLSRGPISMGGNSPYIKDLKGVGNEFSVMISRV